MSRVLFVTNDFPTRRGGIESFVLALCERLPPEEVVVYTASMPGDREYDATLPFPVYRDPAGTLLPTPAVARRVTRVLRTSTATVWCSGPRLHSGCWRPGSGERGCGEWSRSPTATRCGGPACRSPDGSCGGSVTRST